MSTEDKDKELEKNLEELDYNPKEDIFNKEEAVPMDGDGNPITNPTTVADEMPYGLDIPGSEDDDNFEQITSQIPDEENEYYSLSDNEDDHEETNDDLIE